ncbi:MAG: BMP family ABC transporter substrate-binding protein, partial [Spirochaetia bacterium]
MSTQFLKGRRNHVIGVPKLIVFLLVSMVLALAAGCSPKEAVQESASEADAETTADSSSAAAPAEYEIAVFIPGALAGSPTYQMLADGVEQAAQEYEAASVKIVEGGFNQSEWQDKVTQLAATGTYELIVSSNPALPEISRRVSSSFPDQKFLLFDGYLEGEENIYTFRYNQFEQAFLAGHLAGLVTSSSMEGANS